MYYLNSRYYDANIGRFINADATIAKKGDIIGTNIYAYTHNNPIIGIDAFGSFTVWKKIGITLGIAAACAAVIILASVYTGPVAPFIVGATAGLGAQIISNLWHNNDLTDNVAGAAVGGACIATGHPWAAGFLNSIVNQGENLLKNGEFNVTTVFVEGGAYGLLNTIPVTTLKGKIGNGLMGAGLSALGIDSIGFSMTEVITNWIPDVVITYNGEEVGLEIDNENVLVFD